MSWWLAAMTVLALGAMSVAVLAPRPARPAAPGALMALIVAQPLSLTAGMVLWPVAGAQVTAACGMGGLACLLVAVWLMPRDDPWRRPPGGGDGGSGPPDDGPGPTDWDEFERLRRLWAAERALGGS